MKYTKLIVLLLAIYTLGCNSTKNVKTANLDPKVLYQNSIEDAMSPAPDKVYNNLISITRNNKNLVWKIIEGEDYVLVVTWKQNVSYYEPYLNNGFYNTGEYPIWITTAPELLNRMKKENAKDVKMRLRQLLGLPPNSEYSYFVEFWVKPADLFRPCPDNEITDNKCELCFPDKTDSLYVSWVNSNRISRYYSCDLYDKYPWTQLGYTYDWSAENKNHVGLCEFVIGNNKNIVVKAIYTTEEYLKKE